MSGGPPANRDDPLPDHSAPTYLTYHVKAILSIFILNARMSFLDISESEKTN